jgi:rod shape-determining protein MreD
VGRYISLPILFIAAILQSTIVPEIRIGEGGPDLILMLVLSWMMLADLQEGLVWAVVGGILQDLVNGLPTGTSALALVAIAFLVNLVLGPVARSNLVIPPVVLAVGTVAYHVLLMALFAILGRPVPIGYTLIHVTLPTVVFNTVLILPVYRLMGAVYGASRPRRVTL